MEFDGMMNINIMFFQLESKSRSILLRSCSPSIDIHRFNFEILYILIDFGKELFPSAEMSSMC